MNRRHSFLSLLFVFLFLHVPFLLPPAGAATPSVDLRNGTVTRVYDADTLEIAPFGKVRLLGIDAPEREPSPRDDKFLSLGIDRTRLRTIHEEGLTWCLHNVKGRQVTLSFDRSRRDRYGRLLAYIHLADGRLLNRLLIDKGLAIVYRRFPFRLKADFLSAETSARKNGYGIWGHPHPSRNNELLNEQQVNSTNPQPLQNSSRQLK